MRIGDDIIGAVDESGSAPRQRCTVGDIASMAADIVMERLKGQAEPVEWHRGDLVEVRLRGVVTDEEYAGGCRVRIDALSGEFFVENESLRKPEGGR